MVTGLSALTNLRNFDLEFRCPRPRVDREKRLLPRLTRIVYPALASLNIKGNSEFLEDIVGQIDTPLLEQFHLAFFNQLIFDTPLLCDFISRTEAFNAPHRVSISFYDYFVSINLFPREGNIHHRTFSSAISCRPFDWQLSSASQVFNSALSHLTFEHLEIDSSREHRKDNTENADWLEVLHPFTSVKDLVLSWRSVLLVAPALEDLAGGRVTEVLPALQNLFVESRQPPEPIKKAIGKFISERRLLGCPVTAYNMDHSGQDYVLWEVGDQ